WCGFCHGDAGYVDVGAATVDLYDAASNRFVAYGVQGVASFSIPSDGVVILVEVPAGGVVQRSGRQLAVDGVVIDYDAALLPDNLFQNPDVDQAHPNDPARPSGWHYSSGAEWTDEVASSPTHSLKLADTSSDRAEEWRSYATAIPGDSPRSLAVRWFWQYDIAPGHEFGARIRLSSSEVVDLDLAGEMVEYNLAVSGSSSGFEMFETTIPLSADIRSFDITFISAGSLDATGVIFVDDISAAVALLLGDMDGDGDTDFDDIDDFVMGLNDPDGYEALHGVPSSLYGDTDQDGDQDFDDIDDFVTILISSLTGGPAPVPEPSALVLVLAGCLGLARIFRA
ncbi:MAG: hypothetical protein ACC645_08475, partial [Pirellulales bacterium]